MSNSHPKSHVRKIHDKPVSLAHAMLAMSLITAASCWSPAFAVPQDTPTRIDGVKAVCTGVGESKDNPRWSAYPLRLVFADKRGQYTAGEKIDISENGRTVIQARCDAPWLLLKPASGDYRVTATLSGPNGERQASADFSARSSGPQKTVTLAFPVARAS